MICIIFALTKLPTYSSAGSHLKFIAPLPLVCWPICHHPEFACTHTQTHTNYKHCKMISNFYEAGLLSFQSNPLNCMRGFLFVNFSFCPFLFKIFNILEQGGICAVHISVYLRIFCAYFQFFQVCA